MATKRDAVLRSLIYTILAVFSVITLFPYFWMVLTSLRYPQDIFTTQLRLFSKPFTLDNYWIVITHSIIPIAFFNSAVILFCTLVIQISTSALAAFALARGKFPGVKLFTLIFLGTMMIPEEVILLPLYMVVRSLGLLDTRLGTILALSPWGLTIYILMGFFRTIPRELEESATIDGASKFLILRSIIVPISTAALTAVIVFVSVAVWGHIIIPWTIIQSEHLMTIPLALKTFQRQHNFQYNLILAGATLASIPIIIIFALLKRYFIQGAVMGALKE